MYTKETLQRFFPGENGWSIVYLEEGQFDRRTTVSGSRLKCIDRRFGVTRNGYNSEKVPLSPAWLGAVDGIEAFSRRRNPLRRAQEAAQKVKRLGFEPADHGDYTYGRDGCAFKRARRAGLIPGVSPSVGNELDEFIKSKVGVQHIVLREATHHAEGFLMNTQDFTTVLPDDGRYYVIDEWFARLAGIKSEQFLPVVAACGELILPEDSRNLFVV